METTRNYRVEFTLLVALAASAGFFGYLGYGLLDLPVEGASFSADQAMVYVEKQMSFGPRITGTSAHREMGDWMVQELNENGWDVLIQPFRPLPEVEARNFIAFQRVRPGDHSGRALRHAHGLGFGPEPGQPGQTGTWRQ